MWCVVLWMVVIHVTSQKMLGAANYQSISVVCTVLWACHVYLESRSLTMAGMCLPIVLRPLELIHKRMQ